MKVINMTWVCGLSGKFCVELLVILRLFVANALLAARLSILIMPKYEFQIFSNCSFLYFSKSNASGQVDRF